MVIRHNMSALNVQRQFGINGKSKAKTMEKLSSGYRINRAADDAAGLAISEKMRRKIRGLAQGVANTQEGVSVCQVADGALEEVSDMLHRISELSVKSANGTNTDEDREYIQQEVAQLVKEINRIGETTSFNEIKLFDGEEALDGSGLTDMSKPSTNGPFFQLFGTNISKTGYMQEQLTPSMVADTTDTTNFGVGPNPYVSVHIKMDKLGDLKDLVGKTFFVNCCTKCCPTTVNFTDEVGVTRLPGVINIGMKKAADSYYEKEYADFCKYIVDSLKGNHPNHIEFAYGKPDLKTENTLYIFDTDNNAWSQASKEAAYFCDSEDIFGNIQDVGKTIWIHSGNEPGDGIGLKIGNISDRSLGLVGLDVSTVDGADNAIIVSKNALQKVMENRSRIGAQQNRLEHTIANEDNIVENLTSSESRIRDADIAKEMVRLSTVNILEQAGVSMLSQINQNQQGILSLLG